MDQIRFFADLSIRRACGFGFLAIATASIACVWDIQVAVKMAATGTSFMAAVLLWKAIEAPTKNYRRTEVFLLMNRTHEFPEARAQQVFGNILRELYLWHATVTAVTGALLWLLLFGLQLFT
jgi:hypothetical protein